jgi:hypothetical protein
MKRLNVGTWMAMAGVLTMIASYSGLVWAGSGSDPDRQNYLGGWQHVATGFFCAILIGLALLIFGIPVALVLYFEKKKEAKLNREEEPGRPPSL